MTDTPKDATQSEAIQDVHASNKEHRKTFHNRDVLPAPEPLHTRPKPAPQPAPVPTTSACGNFVDGVEVGKDADGNIIYGRRHKGSHK
jgi:hypothetical protein